MTIKRTCSITLLLAVFMVISSCTTTKQEMTFFPGEAMSKLDGSQLILSNQTLKAKWNIVNHSIVLSEVLNKYNGQKVNLENIFLFALEMEDGRILTNLDFIVQDEPKVTDLVATDSLPTSALRYAGKEISTLLTEKGGNISILWKAQLRNGANYVRQNIKIRVVSEPVKIRKVTFFDGKLKGASYAGSVLGSPIIYKNFFFGLEHPIAKSKALFSRTIGSITDKNIDISDLVDTNGEYVIVYEHGGGSDDFNVNSISLLKDGKIISSDQHVLNGYEGGNLYGLQVKNHDKKSAYEIKLDFSKFKNATGTLHLYRKTYDILNFYVNREDELIPGKSISEWSVIGVVSENQKRRDFLYYLERERARPYKQFLHYNCWWDITDDGASSFTSEQLIERMHAWNEKFIKPYNIKLDAFVFDDGWDDLDRVWYFDPVKFPNGFAEQAELCKKYNSGIGVWFSPFGGYLENKRRRVESAHREGLETNDKGLSLAGTNYYNRFLERSLDMLNNYKVNYFKYDGFGGANPKYLPDMEAGTRLIKSLRHNNPDVFVNITVGSWPSPFWLKYADCTWRGSGDLHNAGQGNKTQKFITYRDGTLHNNIVNRAPYYPLNSIMTVGVAYANLGHPSNYINDNLDDFKDMVRSSFGAGSNLQELYISHDRMTKEFWPVLAEAVKWSEENEDLLKDTHWIGGSPINLEVYGFASWKPGKGIITLRNPSDSVLVYDINLNNVLELPNNYRGDYRLSSPWKEDQKNKKIKLNSNSIGKITLAPFELKVLEVYEL